MIFNCVFTTVAAIASVAHPVDSLSDDFGSDPMNFGLSEVVVTGTRVAKPLKNTPVQTVVITSKDIERADATNIQDLLQQVLPGVEFSYAMNQQTHMNLGGFGGQSVLFLVDGERLAGETMDDVDFSRISMADVERIEIVRGASSALYGGNAAGGVINVITRKPVEKWSGNANARIGRHNDQRYSLSFSTNHKIVSNSLVTQYSRINSYDVKSSPDPLTRVVSTIYGNKTFNIRDKLSVDISERLTLSARAGYFFREIPRIVDTPERYRDYSGGLTGYWKISESDNLEISYSFDQYDKSSYMTIDRSDIRNYSNVTNSVRGIYNHVIGRGDILSIGGDYRHDYLNNVKITDGARHETNIDAFAQYDWIITGKWELVGAARYDYFSQGNISRITPKLSARYKPTYNTNIRLAYGMGFRTPTLKERYYNFDMAGIWIVEGNENLRPESSQNINASFDWTYNGYNVTITGYFNSVSDKIATGLPYYKSGDGKQLYLEYVNLDHYNVTGADISLQGSWRCGLSAKVSYAYTHESFARQKNGNTANNQYIPARRHSLTAHVEWLKSLGHDLKLTLGINGRAVSGVKNIEYKDYYDIGAGTIDVHYPPYTLWRISSSCTFREKVKLMLSVDNVFNYKPRYYYLNAPLTDGADIMAGISINL